MSFPFLNLPQELQDHIYEYCIIDAGVNFDLGVTQQGDKKIKIVTRQIAPLQIVNRQISDAYSARLQALQELGQPHFQLNFSSYQAIQDTGAWGYAKLLSSKGIRDCTLIVNKVAAHPPGTLSHLPGAILGAYPVSQLTTGLSNLRKLTIRTNSAGIKTKSCRGMWRGILRRSNMRNTHRAQAQVSTPYARELSSLEVFEVRDGGSVEMHRSREIDLQGVEKWYKTMNEAGDMYLEGGKVEVGPRLELNG